MYRAANRFFILLIMLLGLPLAGVWIFTDRRLSVYFDFPPKFGLVGHAPFSWPVFTGLAILILVCLAPFAVRGIRFFKQEQSRQGGYAEAFPVWGWAGILICAAAWFLDWTRFEWFAGFQAYPFPFMWLGYILVVNAFCCKRTGACLMRRKPAFFLLLFPASAVFWWFFEYLNRFVGNWYYVGVEMPGPAQYIVYATVCFSTVLPAVWSTAELLESFSFFKKAYRNFFVVRPGNPRLVASALLGIGAVGLFFLGIFPNFLFPLLWVSPLLIIVCFQVIDGRRHIFSPVRHGDWSRLLCFAAAALVCGFFWEMWNFYSMARWEYSVPFVHGFQIFEMPLLGYAGYLPFGLECAAVGGVIEELVSGGD
ncbi:MAG: hypothetical protein K9J85_00450 [Desulfobacteraceae bacterium]|nr:hypothetical protein [Desulfobacteraceae bacterium]